MPNPKKKYTIEEARAFAKKNPEAFNKALDKINPDPYRGTRKFAELLINQYPDRFKGLKPENFLSMLDSIAKAESPQGNVIQRSYNKKTKKYYNGPARGYYQIETTSAPTFSNRYKAYQDILKPLSAVPLPDIKVPKSGDVRSLSRDEQARLALANMSTVAAVKKEKLNPLDSQNSWLNFHWNGSPADKPQRQQHWKETFGYKTGGKIEPYTANNNPNIGKGYYELGKGKRIEVKKHGGLIEGNETVAESTGNSKYINKKQPVGLSNFNPLTQVQRSFNSESFKQNPVNGFKEDPELDAPARYEIRDSSIYVPPGKLPRNAEDSLSYNIAETPHAKQLKEYGQNGMMGKMIMDHFSYPKSEQYHTPGTLEHDAHSVRGADMKYDYLQKIMDYNDKTGKLNGKPIDIDSEAMRIQLDKTTFLPTSNIKKEGGSIRPYVTNDPNDPRIQAYRDSNQVYQAMLIQNKLMGGKPIIEPFSNYNKNVNTNDHFTSEKVKKMRERYTEEDISRNPNLKIWKNRKEMLESNTPKRNKDLIKAYKNLGIADKNIAFYNSADLVDTRIAPVGEYFDGVAASPYYKKPIQKVILNQPVKPQVTPQAQTQINTGSSTPVTLGQSSPDSSTGKRLYRLGNKNISEQEFNKYKTLGQHKVVEYGGGGSTNPLTQVPQGYFLNTGQYNKTPQDYHVYNSNKTYIPGQNAARGNAEPMVGLDDPIFNLLTMGSPRAVLGSSKAAANTLAKLATEAGEDIIKTNQIKNILNTSKKILNKKSIDNFKTYLKGKNPDIDVSGADYMKKWHEYPETNARLKKYKNKNFNKLFDSTLNNKDLTLEESKYAFYRHDINSDNINSRLNEFKDKSYRDLLLENGIKDFKKYYSTSRGVSYGSPNKIYSKRLSLSNIFNPYNREQTVAHELSHLSDYNGNYLGPAENEDLLNPFGLTEETRKEAISKIKSKKERKKFEYYTDPTEIRARINQGRFYYNHDPKNEFTQEMVDNLNKKHNFFGMGKYVKDPKIMKDVMNKMWQTIPATGIGAIGVSQLQNKKHANGGKINSKWSIIK